MAADDYDDDGDDDGAVDDDQTMYMNWQQSVASSLSVVGLATAALLVVLAESYCYSMSLLFRLVGADVKPLEHLNSTQMPRFSRLLPSECSLFHHSSELVTYSCYFQIKCFFLRIKSD